MKWHKLFLIAFLFLSILSGAATRYWVGGASTSWTNTANWGTSSGGGAPASVPGTSDIAVFDAGSGANCILSGSITVSSLSLTSGFSRTFIQGNNIIYISGNSQWAGGTFSGGAANFTNTGTFNLSGTSFTSPSASLVVSGTFSYTGGSFIHNNGTIRLSTNSFSVIGSPQFYNLGLIPYYNTITCNSSFTVSNNLMLDATGAWVNFNIASGQSVTANGSLTLSGDNALSINTGTLVANGDIVITNSSSNSGGSATVRIAGSGNQSLTGQGTFGVGSLPNVIVSKPSGTLSLLSYITVKGPLWNLASGVLSPGTSTVCFYNTGTVFTISGTQTLSAVMFYGNYSSHNISNSLTTTGNCTVDASQNTNLNVSTDLTVNGTLYLTGSGYFKLNTGNVNVKGDVRDLNTNTAGCGGTASFLINGTSSQNIFGSSSMYQGAFPPFIVNKSSGTLNLIGYLNFYYGFTWVAGTVNPGSSTCVFTNLAALGSQTVDAAPTGISFYDVIFDQPDYTWTYLKTGIKCLGSVTITAGSGIRPNNNTFTLAGNFTSLNTTATGASQVIYGGTGLSLVLNGTTAQTITSNNPGGSTNKFFVYDLTLNNTAARVNNDDIYPADILTVAHSASLLSGKMLTGNTAYLSLKDGASINTGNSSSFVNGPMRYEMAASATRTLNFPIGESDKWRYASVIVSHTTNTSYTYSTQVVSGSAITSSNEIPASVNNISGVRYFQIERLLTSTGNSSSAGLNGNQTIIIHYEADDLVTDYSNLTIVKSPSTGVTWLDIGGVASANTTGTVYSTSSPSAFTSFSKFALANINGGGNVLPVQLTGFDGHVCDNKICLNWQTASEVNCGSFEVQHTLDGINYKTIGKLPGNGTKASPSFYSLEDPSPQRGVNYYQLRQNDFGGGSNYFAAIAISYKNDGEESLFFPNPSTGFLNLAPGIGTVMIIDAFGNAVKKIPANEVKADISDLPSGIYMLFSNQAGKSGTLLLNK